MDQIYASLGAPGRDPMTSALRTSTSSSSAPAPAAERWRTRWRRRRRAHPRRRARRLRAQEDENWNPEAVWKHLRYRTTERWLDERGESSAVHALLRRRQHQVLGQRALSPPARGLSGDRALRRRLAGVADRLRHAGAVLRPGRASVSRARPARRDPTEPPRGPYPSAGAAFARHGRDRRRCARKGCIRRRCRSG